MCTSIILFRKSHDWPLIIASNRDESLNRKSLLPGRYWNKYPYIVGGKDLKKNGSWIGVSNNKIVSIIHNRETNKLKKKFISRGKLVLEVLKYNNIEYAVKYLKNIEKENFDNFNLFISSIKKCFWIKNDNKYKKIIVKELDEGLHILTGKDYKDKKDKKYAYYFKLFNSLDYPNPTTNNWNEWIFHLNKNHCEMKNNQKICFINKKNNYGTISSSLIAIPNGEKTNKRLIFKYKDFYSKNNSYIDIKI